MTATERLKIVREFLTRAVEDGDAMKNHSTDVYTALYAFTGHGAANIADMLPDAESCRDILADIHASLCCLEHEAKKEQPFRLSGQDAMTDEQREALATLLSMAMAQRRDCERLGQFEQADLFGQHIDAARTAFNLTETP
jgi:hypothetical protein